MSDDGMTLEYVATKFGVPAGKYRVKFLGIRLGHDAGMWFVIDQGVRGVVVHDAAGPVVYVLTRPSTNYYRNLAQQAAVMPVLVGQVI
jgi:hypothetical protein